MERSETKLNSQNASLIKPSLFYHHKYSNVKDSKHKIWNNAAYQYLVKVEEKARPEIESRKTYVIKAKCLISPVSPTPLPSEIHQFVLCIHAPGFI